MSKVALPEPLAWMFDEANQIGGLSTRLCWARHGVPPAYGQNHTGLVTLEMAEAYAASKVREALEEAAHACEARIGQHAPGMTPEDVEDCDEEARLCAGAIRALIPSTPA